MAKSSPIQTSFNAGEFAPEMEGRVDIAKYGSAVRRMENGIPLVQGPCRRRGGTKFVTEVKASANRTWLARFEFNTEQAYVLEFGDLYIRFFTDNGALLEASQNISNITQANPGVLTYVGADPANGDWMYLSGIGGMTQLNGKTVKVANVNAGANTFELDEIDGTNISTLAYTAYTAGGTMARVYSVPTNYAVADLTNADGAFALQMVQSGDVIYMCHPDYPPAKLSRISATSWTWIQWNHFDGGPFDDYDPDQTTTVYASAATGAVTVTASAAIFAATDVGRLFYMEQKKANAITMWETAKVVAAGARRRSDGKTYYTVAGGTTGNVKPTHIAGSAYDGDVGVLWVFEDPGYGWGEITAIGGGGTTATVSVESQLPDQCVLVGNATTRWTFGSWGSVPGYPSHVTFFRNRLVFSRATDRTIWFSVAGDYENFQDRDDAGIVTADMAVTVTVESDESSKIQYIVPGEVLVIGTADGEHVCKEMTDSEPFGPSNVTINRSSKYGSRDVQPVSVGESVLFVQRSGRKLREIVYDSIKGGYQSLDMSIMAPHMVPKGKYIIQMAYQKEPHSIVWVVLSDGALRGFTFNREQYAEPPFGGWHRHTIGGSGIVESVVCVPSPTNDRDDLWMIVRRTVNGNSVRYIEYMKAEYESGDDQEDSFYVDCGLTYDSTPATTISGLRHLEGKTVDVLADGATHPQRTVASGAITLQIAASVVQVGLPCPFKLATLRLEAGAQDGTAQGKTKRINRMVVRLLDTLGGSMGPSETTVDEILFRDGSDPMDSAPDIFTGDKEMPWPGGYEKEGYVWYVNDSPLPATIVAIMPQATTQDR
jgi:hypothetical protein